MPEVTAQAETTVQASPAEVWQALTSPEEFRKFFFGAEIETDWTRGSPIRMKGRLHGRDFENKGEIIASERASLLSFSHWSAQSGLPDMNENYQVVSFELTPQGDATRVTLRQSNLVGGIRPVDIERREEYEKNWRLVLEGLAKLFPAG